MVGRKSAAPLRSRTVRPALSEPLPNDARPHGGRMPLVGDAASVGVALGVAQRSVLIEDAHMLTADLRRLVGGRSVAVPVHAASVDALALAVRQLREPT